MTCENIYDKTEFGNLNMSCKDFYAHCTVPTFDNGAVWFDTICIFSSALLCKVSIAKVRMTICVSTVTNSEIDIELIWTNDATPRHINAKYGRNLVEHGADVLAHYISEAVLGAKTVDCLQQGVLIAHVVAAAHKLRKTWTEQAKLFNGYVALLGADNKQ